MLLYLSIGHNSVVFVSSTRMENTAILAIEKIPRTHICISLVNRLDHIGRKTILRYPNLPSNKHYGISGGIMFWVLGLLALFACNKDIEGDQPGECTDKADNDADGLFDCDDSNCKGSPDCKEKPKKSKNVPASETPKYSQKNLRKGLSFRCDEQTVYNMTKRARVLARSQRR